MQSTSYREYTLDRAKIENAMRNRGIRSISELARRIGVHRNTLNHFLAGQPVFPRSLARLLELLNLTPSESFVVADNKRADMWTAIAPIIDTLHKEFPSVTFVLFGSWARGAARPYSDLDIGVKTKNGLTTDEHLRLIQRVEALNEDLAWRIDLVNLDRAEPQFLSAILPEAKFLAGSLELWNNLGARGHNGREPTPET